MKVPPRELLVVLVGLSTLLAGIRGWDSPAQTGGMAVASLGGNALDGSREDDSGTRAEEGEEDDREHKCEWELHLLATTALTCSLKTVGFFLDIPRGSAETALCRRAFPIRGPPAGC